MPDFSRRFLTLASAIAAAFLSSSPPLVAAQVLVPDANYAWYVGKSALGATITAGAVTAEFVFGAFSIDSPVTLWAAVGGLADGMSVGYGIYEGDSCTTPGGFFTATPVPSNSTVAPGDLSKKYGVLSTKTTALPATQDPSLFPRQLQGRPLVLYDSATSEVLGCSLIRVPVMATTTIYSKAVPGAVVNFVSIDGGAPTWMYGQFLGVAATAKMTYGIYEGNVGSGYTGAQCTSVTNFTDNGDLSSKFGTLTTKLNVQDVSINLTSIVGKTFAIFDGTTLAACGSIVLGATPIVDTSTAPAAPAIPPAANPTTGASITASATKAGTVAGTATTGAAPAATSAGVQGKQGGGGRGSDLWRGIVGAVVGLSCAMVVTVFL
ncbi:hypothetical protein HDU93_001178 [Gonapodya sp. JEL0774]|nr:hypothetical protein HDU93_001178 [Gonapodya sp. JEL0774]